MANESDSELIQSDNWDGAHAQIGALPQISAY